MQLAVIIHPELYHVLQELRTGLSRKFGSIK